MEVISSYLLEDRKQFDPVFVGRSEVFSSSAGIKTLSTYSKEDIINGFKRILGVGCQYSGWPAFFRRYVVFLRQNPDILDSSYSPKYSNIKNLLFFSLNLPIHALECSVCTFEPIFPSGESYSEYTHSCAWCRMCGSGETKVISEDLSETDAEIVTSYRVPSIIDHHADSCVIREYLCDARAILWELETIPEAATSFQGVNRDGTFPSLRSIQSPLNYPYRSSHIPPIQSSELEQADDMDDIEIIDIGDDDLNPLGSVEEDETEMIPSSIRTKNNKNNPLKQTRTLPIDSNPKLSITSHTSSATSTRLEHRVLTSNEILSIIGLLSTCCVDSFQPLSGIEKIVKTTMAVKVSGRSKYRNEELKHEEEQEEKEDNEKGDGLMKGEAGCVFDSTFSLTSHQHLLRKRSLPYVLENLDSFVYSNSDSLFTPKSIRLLLTHLLRTVLFLVTEQQRIEESGEYIDIGIGDHEEEEEDDDEEEEERRGDRKEKGKGRGSKKNKPLNGIKEFDIKESRIKLSL
ncbi:hypothetical protein ADUPG1_006857, partial [Aduncisulcus paluster]